MVELARQIGLIRPRDVEAAGIHRENLLRLYRNGHHEPVETSIGDPDPNRTNASG
ncbi:MAG TPA: type IV toxin-antitoxin system AbiEi family antitoxin domain-containing protein [Deltaproteobacteria bacterium]|nr:type IV toxin-antitoxin system AbiEi family antitoxin domain-containing protein [Deltaproteobacteria bacterium]